MKRLGSLLVSAVLVLSSVVLLQPAARSATSLSVAGPGRGTWQIGQMWHGGALGGGIVPAGTSIDLSPISGSSLDVYAVAAGRIVRTCVSPTQSTVFVDSAGIGVIGYSHLRTGSIPMSGLVAKGQRIGALATTYQKSGCATSWTGPHLHLSFPARYDVLELAGQTASRYRVLSFPTPQVPRTFSRGAVGKLALTRTEARIRVCADNLPGNVVTVRLSRQAKKGSPARVWKVSRVAASRCERFDNLDGPGAITPKRLYGLRVALNQQPSPSWSSAGCTTSTRGQGLCGRARYR